MTHNACARPLHFYWFLQGLLLRLITWRFCLCTILPSLLMDFAWPLFFIINPLIQACLELSINLPVCPTLGINVCHKYKISGAVIVPNTKQLFILHRFGKKGGGVQPDEMSGWGNGNGLAGFGGVGGGGSRHANCPTCLHMRFLFFFFCARLFRETSYFL